MDEADSFVLIKFTGLNSVEFQHSLQNVTPMQLLALAHWMEYKGKSTMQAQEVQMMMEKERQEEQNKIAVPTSNVLRGK